MSQKSKWKWLIVGMALLAIGIAARFLPLLEWLENLTTWLRSLGILGVVLYAFSYAVAAMLCLPCMPLTIAGGYIFGTVSGLIAVHTGTTLAAAGGFLVGRFAGRAHVAERIRARERFHLLDQAIGNDGWRITALLRMLPIAFGPSNYLYGMTAVRFWPYLLATIVGMLPGNLIFTHLGSAGSRTLSGSDGFHPLEGIALAIGVLSMAAVSVLIRRKLLEHKLAGEEKQSDDLPGQ